MSQTKGNRLKEKLLVFGGAGFIGSNFIRHILSRHPDWEVLNYDKLTYSGNKDNLKDIENDRRYRFIKADITDSRRVHGVFKTFRPDYVINFAAETHVDKSIHVGALEFVRTNVEGVFNVLEAVKNTPGVKKFVQVSTDEVYGELPLKRADLKFCESTPFHPNIPYSATKAGGDLLCGAYFHTWKVPVIITHCSNNYGPYQYPEKLIPYFLIRMLEKKKLPIYGNGKNIRDWIYVRDHCRALELCLTSGRTGETYNIGADNERTNMDIARMILRYFKRGEEWIEHVGDRPGHDKRYAIDSTKIKRELGWRPTRRFDEAFRETIEWYVGNVRWINRVRKKTGVFNPHIDLWRAHRNAR